VKTTKKSNIVSAFSLLALLSFVVAIIVPLSGMVINFAIILSLALALTIYTRANTITDWKDLKTFPTIILLTAIFRIALNISTTRTILLTGQPGEFITAAGDFIIGGSIWVGVVVFIILIVVQFIIANGASRTSEVSARFTLDKIPGKQMSIDSDLQSGLIDEKEAKQRRKDLDLEIEFYGNMDGAGKFIKGDVIAGIILIIINVVFGFVIGVLVQGMSAKDAALHYTILTIGDGLVNQVASLLITVASGIVLTRVYDGDDNVSEIIFKEITGNPMVLYIVGSILLAMGIFTELPFFPLFVVGGGILFLAYRIQTKQALVKAETEELERLAQENESKENKGVEVQSKLEAISLEFGIRLVPLLEVKRKGETLDDKVSLMRERISERLGIRIPRIHLIDNVSLLSTEYQISINGVPVIKGNLRPDKLLAVKSGAQTKDLDEGIPTKDPVYGAPAYWIDESDTNLAKSYGYAVSDPLSILSLHLNEMIYRHIHELITRQEVQYLLDDLGNKDKVLIDEIKKYEVKLSFIQKVIVNLLKEKVSIRNLPLVVEAIIDGVQLSNNIDDVTSFVREKLARQLCDNCMQKGEKIFGIYLSREMEEMTKYEDYNGYHFDMDLTTEKALLLGLKEQLDKGDMAGVEPTVITSGKKTRAALVKLMQKYEMPYPVLSMNEVVTGAKVRKVGIAEMKYE